MKKSELIRLNALAKRMVEDARKLDVWVEKYHDMCGHSSGPGSLGDEGWTKSFYKQGQSHGLTNAADSLFYLISRFKEEDKK